MKRTTSLGEELYERIALVHGKRILTKDEYKKFEQGDAIWGVDVCNQETVKSWPIEEKEEAVKELKKHECTYDRCTNHVYIDEWALEYANYTKDEDGEYEFYDGCDYDLAKDDEDYPYCKSKKIAGNWMMRRKKRR